MVGKTKSIPQYGWMKKNIWRLDTGLALEGVLVMIAQPEKWSASRREQGSLSHLGHVSDAVAWGSDSCFQLRS